MPSARSRWETSANSGPDLADLTRAFGVASGDPVDNEAIVKGKADLDAALGERGFAFAQTGEPELVADHARELADLSMPVTIGGRFRFGTIVSNLPDFLPAWHLDEIARFKPGDLYKRSGVDDLRKAIVATGLVSAVTLVPRAVKPPTGTEPGELALDVTMAKAPLRTVSGEIGYDAGEGFRIEAGWEHRNLFPPEGMLRLRAVAGTREQLAGVTFRRNNFRGRDQVLTFDLYGTAIKREAYVAKTVALTGTYEKLTTLLFQKPLVWSLGLEVVGTNEREGDVGGVASAAQTYYVVGLPMRAALDTTDDLLDPGRGFRAALRLSPEGSITKGEKTFYARMQADASAYLPLGKRAVVAARIRLGSIAGAPIASIAPSRRFYAGGGSSVRGFGYQEIGPRDSLGVPGGGRSLSEFSIEARVKTGLLGGQLSLVPFFDAGTVNPGSLPSFSGMRFGAGLGFRYQTGFGPIRIDLATPLDRRARREPGGGLCRAGSGVLMTEAAPPAGARRWLRWLRWLAVPLALLLAAAAALLLLDTSLGHRFLTDRIAALAPKSGLRIEVGRIEGSIYREARLRDVRLYDPQGEFARVPLAELDWRPLAWLSTGIDIRSLVLRRGTLLRLPKLRPGDPDAPVLPAYDIRIDRLELAGLTVAEGIAGPARKIDLVGKAMITKGRALIRADSRLGGSDRLALLLDANPDADRFDLRLDYRAPKGGLLAGLSGVDRALDVAIDGRGGWKLWRGALVATGDGKRLAALRLGNSAGRYDIAGLVWPDGMLHGLAGRAVGQSLAVVADGTFAARRWDGDATLVGQALAVVAEGGIDLGRNSVADLRLTARAADGEALLPGARIEGGVIAATLNGPWRDLAIDHRLGIARLSTGGLAIDGLTQKGLGQYTEGQLRVPLDTGAVRVTTGDAEIDSRLKPVRLTGPLVLAGNSLSSDRLMLSVPGLAAQLALRGDVATGAFGVAGPFAARGLALRDLGAADAEGRLIARFGRAPWQASVDLQGRMARVDNATLTALAGTGIRFGGRLGLGARQPLLVERATLSGSKLAMGLAGRVVPGGRTTISGKGRQSDYGPFTVNAEIAADGPRAVLTFADPLPAAGLRDVRVALAPITGGFRIQTEGQSTLGPFDGTLGLFIAKDGATRIAVERLDVAQTSVTGDLALAGGAARGRLALSGGGVQGTIDLAPRDGGQGFAVALTANNARFGGAQPLTIAVARVNAEGLLRKGHTSISGNASGQGIGQGQLFIGRIAANAAMTDGRGRFTASLAGRRGSRFELQMLGDIAPDRLALAAQGQFAGQRIMMPRRAVLTRETGGWRLAPTQIDYASGRAIASGLIGAESNDLHVALADMPLDAGRCAAGRDGPRRPDLGTGRLPNPARRRPDRGIQGAGCRADPFGPDADLAADGPGADRGAACRPSGSARDCQRRRAGTRATARAGDRIGPRWRSCRAHPAGRAVRPAALFRARRRAVAARRAGDVRSHRADFRRRRCHWLRRCTGDPRLARG